MSSFFRLLKKLSVGALSQQLPLRLIEQCMPYSASLRLKGFTGVLHAAVGVMNQPWRRPAPNTKPCSAHRKPA